MFILSRLSDNIRVQPSELSKPPLQSVTEVIQERYFDKVIPQLGLVVTLYDVLSIEGGFIHPNDGAAYFKVEFRVVVFRPFVGEVITGKLRTCSKEGLYISLGDFFDDVFVPEHALQEPSFFNDVEKLWLWKFDGNDMFMDLGEDIRFKVHAVKFHSPPTPLEIANATGDDKLRGTAAKPYVPMEVVGDINADGLGLCSWWQPADEEAAGEGGEAQGMES